MSRKDRYVTDLWIIGSATHLTKVPSLTLLVGLAACAGGGRDSTTPGTTTAPFVSVPASVSASPPLVSPVVLLAAPGPQEFPTFSTGDPLRIRYDAATGKYEVLAPGRDWDALIDDPLSEPGAYLLASAPRFSAAHFSARARHEHPTPELRYRYSSLVSWEIKPAAGGANLRGLSVFGLPTSTGGVPVTGSASYEGVILGDASVPATSGWGNWERAPIGGSVALHFDFGRGSLSGEIRPRLECDCDRIEFPTLSFVRTALGASSPTFSGSFDTPVTGSNGFNGLLTGPQAQELIGRWEFPFLHSGRPESATGVWIAKRGE